MSTIFAIARVTLLETVRRRIVLALFVLTVLVALLTLWGLSNLSGATDDSGIRLTPGAVKLVASQLFIFIAFSFTGVMALLSALVTGQPMASAIESGAALSVLARPVRRSSFYLGTLLGISALLIGYTLIAGGAEMLVVNITTGYLPPDPLTVLLSLSALGIELAALTLTLATRAGAVASGVIVVVCFFVCWLGGIAGAVGSVINNDTLRNAGTISHLVLPSDGLWRNGLFAMEPPTIVGLSQLVAPAAANPFLASHPQDLSYLAWCAVWLVLVALLGIRGLNRREI